MPCPLSACLSLEPVDDLAAGRLPHACIGADVPEHLVEMPNPPWLPHDPWMQVQYHQATGRRAVRVETVEPLAPQQIDFVDRAAAMQVDVVVVEIGVDSKR